MKVRDVIKRGSVVEVLSEKDDLLGSGPPKGTLGRVTDQEVRKGKYYWVVSFPLPQIDMDECVWLYSEERPEMQVLYRPGELKRVHGKKPDPVTLVAARFINGGAAYALYDVTRDERLLTLRSILELGGMPLPDPPLEAAVSVEQVRPFCAERGWRLFYKQGERYYDYTADLMYRAGEENVLPMNATGTLLATDDTEAVKLARAALLRDYPLEDHWSGHESVQLV